MTAVVEAAQHRDDIGATAAVARVEQLFPWPYEAVAKELARFPNCKEIVWLQEEPENMGPWNSIKGNLFRAHEDTHEIIRVSRLESGSPATGTKRIHDVEQAELFEQILAFDD